MLRASDTYDSAVPTPSGNRPDMRLRPSGEPKIVIARSAEIRNDPQPQLATITPQQSSSYSLLSRNGSPMAASPSLVVTVRSHGPSPLSSTSTLLAREFQQFPFFILLTEASVDFPFPVSELSLEDPDPSTVAAEKTWEDRRRRLIGQKAALVHAQREYEAAKQAEDEAFERYLELRGPL